MKPVVIIAIAFVLLVPFVSIHAQSQNIVIVNHEKYYYSQGDVIRISGQIQYLDPQKSLILKIFSPTNDAIWIKELVVGDDKKFSTEIIADKEFLTTGGLYRINAQYGNDRLYSANSDFEFKFPNDTIIENSSEPSVSLESPTELPSTPSLNTDNADSFLDISEFDFTSIDSITIYFDYRLLELMQQIGFPSHEEITEFIGEEKRQMYDETFEAIKQRGITNIDPNSASFSRLSEYEKEVFYDSMKQSAELTKYTSAKILYEIDKLIILVKEEIQNTNLSQTEKDSLITKFDFYAETKRTGTISILINQILNMQPPLTHQQESGEKIGRDIGNYYNEIKNSVSPLENSSNNLDSKGGGCLIATATFDSELSPQVQKLREIRDSKLLQTESGTSFMELFNSFYYSFSPIIADYERENPVFKEMVKTAITPMLSTLSLMDYAESEAEVLTIGISLIILNGMMYVGIPVIGIIVIRRF